MSGWHHRCSHRGRVSDGTAGDQKLIALVFFRKRPPSPRWMRSGLSMLTSFIPQQALTMTHHHVALIVSAISIPKCCSYKTWFQNQMFWLFLSLLDVRVAPQRQVSDTKLIALECSRTRPASPRRMRSGINLLISFIPPQALTMTYNHVALIVSVISIPRCWTELDCWMRRFHCWANPSRCQGGTTAAPTEAGFQMVLPAIGSWLLWYFSGRDHRARDGWGLESRYWHHSFFTIMLRW